MFNNIGDFLLKRLGPAVAHNAFLLNISNIIKENTGIEISEKKISIKNKILFIKTNPIRKQEILIKKDKLLSDIKDLNYKIEVIDIN